MSDPQVPPSPPSSAPPPGPPPPEAKDGEIPLEDIDRLLQDVDPEFTKSLEEVRAVESDQDVVIDASAIDEELGQEGDGAEDKSESRLQRWRTKIKLKMYAFRLACKKKLQHMAANLWVFLKTRPKEYALYSIALGKVLSKKVTIPFKAYQKAERAQKITVLILVAVVVASLWTLLANVKGIWIPRITEPMLTSLETVADSVETYKSEDIENFYAAFPQERHEYLFNRMKVNLRRTSDSPNPMGAFEVIVAVDSKDTAIEVSDREVEFFDMLQRVFEEESVTDLGTEMGKNRLKSRIKRELNQKLTQGWVKEISFKTFVLKP